MNKSRIQVDGVWYVREDSIKPSDFEFNIKDITFYKGCVYENETSCFDVSKLDNYPDTLSIKYTDKRPSDQSNLFNVESTKEDWIEHDWDNISWINGLIEENPESIQEIDDLEESDVKILIRMLQHLKQIGWITNEEK